ncbi:acyl carrier protein [Streptomyces sp. ME19-01-6]|uniref:acyl carrier protein n=1 Tax=Streptomyces sp. ME19-01-6 TaxID=3028686 RepID=UPI0029A893DB|nr:acyl carrier protein [Streptomyces sp. ME19-01-6]MDX3231793.1 acyl carrier protein [Streptomyces sp. ME19-01-6]
MTAGNRDVHTWLTERVAKYLRRSPEDIDTSVPLADYGLDSLTALAITADIEDEFEVTVDDALTWDHPTVDALSAALSALVGEQAQAAHTSGEQA